MLASKDAEISAFKSWAEALQTENFKLFVALQDAQQAQTVETAPLISEEPEIKFEKQPLYMSEEQEDVQWQFDHDMINLDQYQKMLADLEFENSEIQFAEDLTENYHY